MDELKNNNNDLLHAQNSIRFVNYKLNEVV